VLEEADAQDWPLYDLPRSSRSMSEEKGEGGIRHSGRSIIPDMPSRIAGRSVPDID
jgi:hypothetical protein